MIVFVLAHKGTWMSYAIWEDNETFLRYDEVPTIMQIYQEPGHIYEVNSDYSSMSEIEDPITRLTLIENLTHKLENKVYLHKLQINLHDVNISMGNNYNKYTQAILTVAENLSNNQTIVTLVQPEFMSISNYTYFEETDDPLVTITGTLELYSSHKAYPIDDITFNYLKLHKANLEHNTLYNVYKGKNKLTNLLQGHNLDLTPPVKAEIKIFDYLVPVHDYEMRYCEYCKFSSVTPKGGLILPCPHCRKTTLLPVGFLYKDERTSHYLGSKTHIPNEQFNTLVILGTTSEDDNKVSTYFLYNLKANYHVKRKLMFTLRLNKS
jgi:hypothetical protein